MYGDNSVSLQECPVVNQRDPLGGTASLFDVSEDLGVGAGDVERRRIEDAKLMKVIGAKLHRARVLSGLSESAVGLALHHSGVTQVSLYENGKRFPSYSNLRVMAKLYGVTVDYLLDMHDDILMEPEEGNQAVLRGVVAASITQDFTHFVDVMAKRNALVIEGLSRDRLLLQETGALSADLVSSLSVFKRHAPDLGSLQNSEKIVR